MRSFALKLISRMLTATALLAVCAEDARGQAYFRDDFEGPIPSWSAPQGNARFQLEAHQRVQDGAHWGQWSEYMRIAAGNGTYLHSSYEVGQARVIEELRPSVWIKADRPGIHLLARVVLPRTRDPRSGRPATMLLPGSRYAAPGTWQPLYVEKLPQLVERQARLLRLELGRDVDTREAFVDRLVLNVYGGIGATSVWIDDLEIAGYVRPPIMQASYRGDVLGESAVPAQARPSVKMNGSILLVDDQPMFPRVVEYQGEPLHVLKELGFNTIKLGQLPTADLLQEAARSKMWLICPPPIPPNHVIDRNQGTGTLIGPAFDPVLMWNLGDRLTTTELERTQRWAEVVRMADREHSRPLICGAASDLRAFSRAVDILVLSRDPLGTSLELADFATWVRERPRLARPGTPIWVQVQTEPDETLVDQVRGLAGAQQPLIHFSTAQLRLLTYAALSTGTRGVIFSSHTRLDSADRATRLRAQILELLNLELSLIEPFTASGNRIGVVPANVRDVEGVVLQTKRARLMLASWAGRGGQYVPGQAASTGVSFVVPGVPESHEAFELTPAGLTRIRDKRRMAGGVQMTLDEFGLTALLLLTEDPLVQSRLHRQLQKHAVRAAQLQREIAVAEAALVTELHAQLAGRDQSPEGADEMFRMASQRLQQCDNQLAAGNFPAAYQEAARALRPLRMVQRSHWDGAIRALGSPVASPLSISFATLPQHWALIENLRDAQFGGSVLRGGEFERIDAMQAAGWRNFQHRQPGIRALAELSPKEPKSGNFSLRLAASPDADETQAGLVETAPIWVTSPGVTVEAGQLVRIQAWVRVPEALVGSVDGLMMIDSLGGEALAERIVQTNGWQPIRMLRVAPRSGTMTVTFALTGLGEVFLDDVTIEPVYRPGQPVPEQASRLPVISLDRL